MLLVYAKYNTFRYLQQQKNRKNQKATTQLRTQQTFCFPKEYVQPNTKKGQIKQ